MEGQQAREARGADTKETILTVAEQLFAEHGVFAVSNRHISEAAGQGNNAAVGYHFGTKTDLVRAIVRRHAEPIEVLRKEQLTELRDSRKLREWVSCLVRPGVEHLASLGSPSWYGRFAAQVMTDPGLREIMVDETFGPSIRRTLDGLNHCTPNLPVPVRLQRGEMAQILLTHALAERERQLAAGSAPAQEDWTAFATGLIDALVGLWLAPVTSEH